MRKMGLPKTLLDMWTFTTRLLGMWTFMAPLFAMLSGALANVNDEVSNLSLCYF